MTSTPFRRAAVRTVAIALVLVLLTGSLTACADFEILVGSGEPSESEHPEDDEWLMPREEERRQRPDGNNSFDSAPDR